MMSDPRWNVHLGNIFAVWVRSDRVDRESGMNAYNFYRDSLTRIAKPLGSSTQIAAAVFAALSPNADYKSNLESTKRMLIAFHRGDALDSFQVTTYGANKRKAWAILHTGDTTLIKAQKTLNFYRNISNPDDSWPVTVDGHMLSVWSLKRFKMQGAGLGRGQYDEIASDFRTAALVLGVLPNQLQATCWFTWKRVMMINQDAGELQLPLMYGDGQ